MQNSQAMKSFVVNLLNDKLPPFYFYHNSGHTLYVMDKAIEIGRGENCSDREIHLLTAAALWHDSGFINTKINHEKEGCLLARQYLPAFDFSDADINCICGMIMATKMPQSPQNKLEQIIADADLEYLGTGGAEEKAAALFRELQYLTPSLTAQLWQKMQVSFLSTHRYFTSFCKKNRQPAQDAYLQRLLNNIA